MIGSLRFRLLIGASGASIVVLTLLGTGVYVAMRHALMRDFDASLTTDARLLEGMIDQDAARTTFQFQPAQMPDFLAESGGRFFEIWTKDGHVLARSPSLGNDDLPRSDAAPNTISKIELPHHHRHARSVLLSFAPSPDDQESNEPLAPPPPIQIMVAAEPADVIRTLGLLGAFQTILCAAAVVVIGAVLLRVVNRAIVPVRKLASRIESLGEAELSHRLPRDGIPDELVPVVDKLNGLLARLNAAFAREKSFTADVSHELRTPLAGLRMILEVCRSKPRDLAAYETAIDECLVITDRMEAMSQSLLILTRSDAGQLAVAAKKFDLSETISQIWNLFQIRALRHHLIVSIQAPGSCVIQTDPEKLQIVLQNVFDNAVSYADEGGQIRIVVHASAGHDVTVDIANTGSLVDSSDVPRLFERFARGDASRTGSGLHCGLGLSLSRRLMNLLGGEISIQAHKGGEFIVRLRLSPALSVDQCPDPAVKSQQISSLRPPVAQPGFQAG